MDFSGRVALVTGAGSPQGIGFATARLLAQQGAKIAITSTTQRINDRAHELASQCEDVFAFTADLRDRDWTHALIDQAITRFGRIDVLVNNAGMTQIGNPELTVTASLVDLPKENGTTASQ